MAEIVFKYEEMENAAKQIDGLQQQFSTNGKNFVTDFTASIADWEGESKEKMKTFIEGAVQTYMVETVPGILGSLAELLRQNAAQMQQADAQIAENIPQSLG